MPNPPQPPKVNKPADGQPVEKPAKKRLRKVKAKEEVPAAN